MLNWAKSSYGLVSLIHSEGKVSFPILFWYFINRKPRIANIQPGDVVIDPCCGMGTIPIGNVTPRNNACNS